MNDLRVLIAELNRGLQVSNKIMAFLQNTEQDELAKSGKTPATALMMAGILENYYTCLETMFLRISQFF